MRIDEKKLETGDLECDGIVKTGLKIEEEPLFNPIHLLTLAERARMVSFLSQAVLGHPTYIHTYIAMWLQKGNPEP